LMCLDLTMLHSPGNLLGLLRDRDMILEWTKSGMIG
jgi:hypothetical protein